MENKLNQSGCNLSLPFKIRCVLHRGTQQTGEHIFGLAGRPSVTSLAETDFAGLEKKYCRLQQ